MKKIRYLAFVLLACLFASCLSMQSKSYVILNPDMSGKCTYEIKMGKDMAGILTMPKDDLYGYGAYENKTPKKINSDAALALASKLLSSGTIDAWKDVQFGYLKKDTVFFKGTAYFKDVTKLSVSLFDSTLKVYKNSDGNMVLEMADKKAKKDTAMSWTNHSYDSIYNNMYKGMGLSDLMHYYYACMVKGLDIRSTYQLPGKIVSSSNFVKKNDYTVSIALTGDDIIKLLDTMVNGSMSSDIYSKYMSGMAMPANNQNSMGTSDDPYLYNKIVYGEEKPVQVTFKADGKPAFDYSKEVAEAKKEYKQFRKTSGIETYDSLQAIAAKEAEEQKQKEEGTLVLTAADSAHGKIYLKSLKAKQYEGYMSFTGVFSRPVGNEYSATVKLKKALGDNGLNVLDSLNKKNSYMDLYDSNSSEKNTISAYLSSSSYSYNLNPDTTSNSAGNNQITFSLYGTLPSDVNYISIEGEIYIGSEPRIPFKMIKLYPKKDDYSDKW